MSHAELQLITNYKDVCVHKEPNNLYHTCDREFLSSTLPALFDLQMSMCVMLFATASNGSLGGWSLRMGVYTTSGTRRTWNMSHVQYLFGYQEAQYKNKQLSTHPSVLRLWFTFRASLRPRAPTSEISL